MNTFFFISVITVLFYSAYSSPASTDHTISKKVGNDAIRQTQDCTFKICFAIDGSGSVSSNDFRMAKNFVQTTSNQLAAFLPGQTQYSAVQFGQISYPISLLTTDLENFYQQIEAEKIIGDSATSISAGIVMCDSILSLETSKGPYVMVVLTDGRNSIGRDPVASANRFRSIDPANTVFAVRMGNSDEDRLTKIVGTSGEIFNVSESSTLFLRVNQLFTDQC